LLNTNRASLAHGGPEGGPADDETHHQKLMQEVFMSAIILTGLSHNGHKFSLTYPEVDGEVKCFAHCTCGYEVEILYFKSYSGVKNVQRRWEEHIKNNKKRVKT
jgi:hypothetical protein